MTYEACLQFLYSQLPIYQRIGKAAYKADLNNTIQLMTLLDNPENKFKSIHLAGTNGKGSVSHMLASVLQESGMRVGLYTSPHLVDFRERVKINGEMISKDEVIDFVKRNQRLVEDVKPSFFEWTVALAFNYFAHNEVDIAVIETGLGGRLDSTNVITPEVSVITNIGHDHMRFLGNRLEDIAGEKAGIIKDNVPVVIGSALPETAPIFEKKAAQTNSKLIYAQENIYPVFDMDLDGFYQIENQQTALATIEVLKERGFAISDEDIEQGMLNIKSSTGLLGRWQKIAGSPNVIVDIAHNKEGVLTMLDTLEKEDFHGLHIVWGTVDDKDAGDILRLLPALATFYFCAPNIPRAMDVIKLYKTATEFGLTGKYYDSVEDAYEAALQSAEKDDLVLVSGSTFVVAEVLSVHKLEA